MAEESGRKPQANDRTLIGVSSAPGRLAGAASKAPAGLPRGGAPTGRPGSNERTLLGVAAATYVPASAKSVAALEPGAIVADHYVLGEPIQEGGMATIWAATDRATGRPVIVKTIHLHLSDSEEVVQRFQREADVIAAVRSPHVVELLDRGVLAGSPFLVLERLEGEDLEERLAGRRLSVDECAQLLDQVALALAPAHAAGVVHRDLKPGNIYFARHQGGEVVKLLDFGIAKLRESTLALTAAGQTVGTPEYMSPEQLQGRSDLDGRSDLFAMAAVLYAALTGRPPFDADGLAETFERIAAGNLTPPSRAARDVPRRIDAFFSRALAFDRDARYPDAAAMAAAFRVFAADDAPDVEVAAAREPSRTPPLAAPPPERAPRSTASAAAPPRAASPGAVPLRAGPPRAGSSRAMWLVVAVAIGLVLAAVALVASSDDAAPSGSVRRPRSRSEQVPASPSSTVLP